MSGRHLFAVEVRSERAVPGCAGILPATGRRPAIVHAGKMPAHPEGRFALQDDFHAAGWADTGS